MLTSTEHFKLKKLLALEEQQDQILNISEVQGFLFGLAITPEDIEPCEWLLKVFGEENTSFADQAESAPIIAAILAIYNRFNGLHEKNELYFPYCLKEPSEETVANALDWGFGFNLALEMRPEIWLGNGPIESMDADNSLFASFSVLNGIAWADEVDEFCAGDDCPNQPKDECELLATLLVALPEAVEVIQDYAARLKIRPSKIGRNEPCPCASGMKFISCCSDSRSTLQ